MANTCSWKAGPELCNLMDNYEFKSWEKLSIAIADNKVLGLIGYKEVYIASNETGLYKKMNFKRIDEQKDNWGHLQQIFVRKTQWKIFQN